MKLNDKIKELEARSVALKDQLSEITKSVDAENDLSDEQMDQVAILNTDYEANEKALSTYRTTEANLMKSIAKPQGTPGIVAAKHLGSNEDGLSLFTKFAVSKMMAHVKGVSLAQAQHDTYGESAELEAIAKAAVMPADTTTTGWAAELIQTMYGGFLEALTANSFYGRLSALGTSLDFGRNHSITLPSANPVGTTDLGGSFIGEGLLIPVKKTRFASVQMEKNKLAVISDFTRQIVESSIPSIERLVQDQMVSDTRNVIDQKLISADAAVAGISPAGLMNGVTATASSGTTTANIITDIRALVNPLLAANNAENVVILLNEQHLLGLSLATTAAGNFMFPSVGANGSLLGYPLIASNNIPVGTVMAVAARDFASAFGAFDMRVSDTATLVQADDAAAKPDITDHGDLTGHITDGTNPASVRSLFQQDLIAIRMMLDCGWTMRRAGAVTALSGVAW